MRVLFPLRAQRIAAFEREKLTGLVRAFSGYVSQAAREVRIPRGTLYRLLKEQEMYRTRLSGYQIGRQRSFGGCGQESTFDLSVSLGIEST